MAHFILLPISQLNFNNEKKKNWHKNPTLKMNVWSTWFYACDKIAQNFNVDLIMWVDKRKSEISNKHSKAGSSQGNTIFEVFNTQQAESN